jgi:hypothetical protein
MSHLQPAVVLESLHEGPRLVLCVDDTAEAAAVSGEGVYLQAALDRGKVQLQGTRCMIKD